MSTPVIEVSGVGKAFARKFGPRRLLAEMLGLRQPVTQQVLSDISFCVGRGEAVGIVGVNGAGKSTLLKILTGTMAASAGTVRIAGQVSALLELGIGFHPDLTGRENAYSSSQMAGRSRAEIDRVIGEIEAFAEVGDYFDQPMRTYSSGMQVRVAFSVATALQPDVLIVDEAMSVGDAYFQHKSFARIRDFKKMGTTLLFVSHDPGAVKSICDRAILLDRGRVALDAPAHQVMEFYNALIAEREDGSLRGNPAEFSGRSGSGEARTLRVYLRSGGQERETVTSGDAVAIVVRYRCERPLDDLAIGIAIHDRTGNLLYGVNTWRLGLRQGLGALAGTPREVEFIVPALMLGAGSYSVTVALHSCEDHLDQNFDWWDRAHVFKVVAGSQTVSIGPLALPLEARIDAEAMASPPSETRITA